VGANSRYPLYPRKKAWDAAAIGAKKQIVFTKSSAALIQTPDLKT